MPHCPICGLEPTDSSSRCPIDNAFFQSRICIACGEEVGWRDRHCGWCGSVLDKNTGHAIVDLEKASFWAIAAADCIDGFLILVMAPILFSFVPQTGPLGSLPVCLPFLWFYWAILWSCGRQSLGQFVCRLITLDQNRIPLSLKQVAASLSLGPRRLSFWRIKT